MAIEQRFCVNHPTRPAIGVCVMTKVAICGECSTRYEGVNYSRQGLLMLRQQRAGAAESRDRRTRRVVGVLAWCLAPALLYLMYLGYVAAGNLLATVLHPEV